MFERSRREAPAVNARVFYGKAWEALVFNSQGQVFKGNLQDAAQFGITKAGAVIPHFDKLKQIIP